MRRALARLESGRLQQVRLAAHGALDVHDLQQAVRLVVGEQLLVHGVEGFTDRPQRCRADGGMSDVHGAFVHLAEVTHVDAALESDAVARDAL